MHCTGMMAQLTDGRTIAIPRVGGDVPKSEYVRPLSALP